MDKNLQTYFAEIKIRGLSPEREERLLVELSDRRDHGVDAALRAVVEPHPFYGTGDLAALQDSPPLRGSYTAGIRSLDELLERDRQREKDGFPRKIRIGRMIRPGRKGGKERFVIVPTTVEEKFVHDRVKVPEEGEGTSGGSGAGEEGEVIGEQPVRPE
ncbi:MAG: hypothetical protein NDI77_15225, partial [Geobacteraceae bacterium]|nr:hypothetical protein [Geobacteraceae bacterium]